MTTTTEDRLDRMERENIDLHDMIRRTAENIEALTPKVQANAEAIGRLERVVAELAKRSS